MRACLPVLACLLVAGCDVFGEDLRPIPDVMLVGLTEDGVLHLETEGYEYCGGSIYVDSQIRLGVVVVDVRGADSTAGICDMVQSGQWSLSLSEAASEIRVRHQGETDRYRVVHAEGRRQLDALRTSTTRPGLR